MANNKSIQILRGAVSYDPATSEEVLLDGQPFYSKKTKQLYVGETDSSGNTQAIKNLKPVTANLQAGSGENSTRQIYFKDADYSAQAIGENSIALNGKRYDKLSDTKRTPTSAEGKQSFAAGGSNHAKGDWAVALGKDTVAYQKGSFSMGGGTQAGCTQEEFAQLKPGEDYAASYSFGAAFGDSTKALGRASFAEGARSVTKGYASHAEGQNTLAQEDNSHAEGFEAKALATKAHAEGDSTTASGVASHAEGGITTASGDRSHAEGILSKASGDASHAENNSVASGNQSHSEGRGVASGEASHAEGSGEASGYISHAEGFKTKAIGNFSHAEGTNTEAHSAGSHVEGNYNYIKNFLPTSGGSSGGGSGEITPPSTGTPSEDNWNADEHLGERSHAEGVNNISYGYASHVEGFNNKIYGHMSHAEGSGNTTGQFLNGVISKGLQAHVEGQNSEALGDQSHAEGYNTHARGKGSHSEGSSSWAYGDYSHAGGLNTQAIGKNSFAHGYQLKAEGENQSVFGVYNKESSDSIFIVGNGTSESDRKNSFEILKGGMVRVYSTPTNAYDVVRKNELDSKLSIQGGTVYNYLNVASGKFNVGSSNNIGQNGSAVIGLGLKSNLYYQTVVGRYNVENTNAFFQVGNGTSDSDRKTAFEVLNDGTTHFNKFKWEPTTGSSVGYASFSNTNNGVEYNHTGTEMKVAMNSSGFSIMQRGKYLLETNESSIDLEDSYGYISLRDILFEKNCFYNKTANKINLPDSEGTLALTKQLPGSAGDSDQPVYFSNGSPIACNWGIRIYSTSGQSASGIITIYK